MRKWEKLNEDKKENNWKKNGLNDIKKLYKIESRQDDDNVSHIKVFLNIEPEDTSKSETKDQIVIGSIVEWTKNKKTFRGEVIEITKKRDKCRICCKPNKQSGDKGSTYMVPKNLVKLN